MIEKVRFADGYFDDEWMEDTRELWAQGGNGLWQFISSRLVAQEIVDAPSNVRQLFEDTFDRSRDLLAMSGEIEDLALEYLNAGVVPVKFEDDAKHVATCMVHRVNHLVRSNSS